MPNNSKASPTERLVSLDVFRGITIAGMVLVNNPGTWEHIYWPLQHAQWHGWTPTDLVFPFFLFIVGVAITLAFGSRTESGRSTRDLYLKVVKRTLIIFAIGLFLNAFPYFGVSDLSSRFDLSEVFNQTQQTIPQITRNCTKKFRVGSCHFVDRCH